MRPEGTEDARDASPAARDLCPFLARLDPRCILPRLDGTLVADLVHYCGGRARECPQFARLAAAPAPPPPAEARALT